MLLSGSGALTDGVRLRPCRCGDKDVIGGRVTGVAMGTSVLTGAGRCWWGIGDDPIGGRTGDGAVPNVADLVGGEKYCCWGVGDEDTRGRAAGGPMPGGDGLTGGERICCRGLGDKDATGGSTAGVAAVAVSFAVLGRGGACFVGEIPVIAGGSADAWSSVFGIDDSDLCTGEDKVAIVDGLGC